MTHFRTEEQKRERIRENARARYRLEHPEVKAYRRYDAEKVSAAEKRAVRLQQKRDEHARHREARVTSMKSKRLKGLEIKAGRPCPEKCEVCDRPNQKVGATICFDHDHKTGNFRGWLCMFCNSVLGKCDDDPFLLEKLALYLRKSRENREKTVV